MNDSNFFPLDWRVDSVKLMYIISVIRESTTLATWRLIPN